MWPFRRKNEDDFSSGRFSVAGVLKALEDHHIQIDLISGTSSGSLIASLYAMGYSPYYIYRLFKRNAKKVVSTNSSACKCNS